MCGSPKLIAACHVLLRLSLPRHPPCALSSLTIELTPAQGAESLRSCFKVNLSPPLSAHRSAHANRSQSPKDTLLHLNTLPELVASLTQLLVLGLVCIRLWNLTPTYAPRGGQIGFPKYVTQSISLSNIQTFLYVEKRPALGLLKPAGLTRSHDRIQPASRLKPDKVRRQS